MVVAVTTVAVALAYAIRPNERRLALLRPLSLATIFSSLCSFTVGIATILTGMAPAAGELSAKSWGQIAMGTAETFTPLFGAFGCLAVAWLFAAIGMRRP